MTRTTYLPTTGHLLLAASDRLLEPKAHATPHFTGGETEAEGIEFPDEHTSIGSPFLGSHLQRQSHCLILSLRPAVLLSRLVILGDGLPLGTAHREPNRALAQSDRTLDR